jgi:hypothetical protein
LDWNVYKVFKNGKRAKAPIMSFAYDNEATVEEYFKSEIKKNFNEKIRELTYILLRGDTNQERPAEQTDKLKEDVLKKQTLILGRLVKDASITTKYKVVGGLIFARATNWKWQWCALEGGTNNFIAGLSPCFNNPSEAHAWMEQQIQNLN